MKLVKLKIISAAIPVSQLKAAQLRELQRALSLLGYPVGDIDGEFGPKTRNAWAEFVSEVLGGAPHLVGAEAVAKLQEKLGEIEVGKPHDFTTREGTIKVITRQCQALGLGLKSQVAYVLATVEWETGKTFKPVRETYWKDEDWRRDNLTYYPYYGRGYVQLTWETNYKKYSQMLGVDLLKNPDKVMNHKIALFVLVHGFKTGTFTGRKITEYINEDKTDWVNARRCINATDHAEEIAELAKKFLKNLA